MQKLTHSSFVLYPQGTESGELYEPGIYASLVIPTLLIGTVGGGTGTPTAKESLRMMGCFGKVGILPCK